MSAGLPRPRVAANFAITWDGKTTTRTRSPTTFTSPADKQRLREIRAGACAVMAGAATVAADSMSMGLGSAELRAERSARGLAPEPLRVIMSRTGALNPSWKVFRHEGSPVVIFSGRRPPRASRLPDFCDLHILPGGPSLPVALAILREDYGVRRLVCEGGPRLFRALIEADMVDEIFLTIVPRVFGGARAPTLTGLPGGWLPEPRRFRLIQSQNLAAGELHCRFLRCQSPARKIKIQAGLGKR